MSRTLRTSATLSLVALLACAAIAFAAETGPITPERAQEIALAQTGGGQIVLLVHSGGGPNQFYKVEVVNNNTRYHLQIDAFNGSLRKFVQNSQGGGAPVVVTPPANAATPVIPPSVASGATPLTREQALALAQQMTNGGTLVESKTKNKRYGQTVHEFELINNGTKYEIDIDAATGNILEFTQKGGYAHLAPSPVGGGTLPRLDMAAAVEIAKRQTNGGAVTDYELDTDDNRLIHEVEIDNGNRRFEVEIDDATGEIVKLKQK